MTAGGSTTAGTLLRVDGVTYAYPGAAGPAIREVTFAAGAGEVVAVVGASGSGKSTLTRLIAGLLRPVSGRIDAAGLDTRLARPQAVATRVGLVFQNPSHQLLAARVEDELALGPRNLGCGPAEVSERVRDAARRMAIGEVLDQHPYRLPIAVRKRVSIAAVLAMRPSILVLDEPTTGQGPAEVRTVRELIRSEASRGIAIVVVAHDLQFAADVADRLVVLQAGSIVAGGSARSVLADATSLRVAGLEAPPLVRLSLALGLGGAAGVPVTLDEVEAALVAHGSRERRE